MKIETFQRYIRSTVGRIYTSRSNTLDTKDGGNVTTQEVGRYLVYRCYLAESCQQAHFNSQREKARETEKCVMLLTMKIRQPVC